MDPLDDAFSAMRVRESLYARLDASAPWAVRFREGKAARFGLVISGACWLTTEAPAQSIRLEAGDCYFLSSSFLHAVRPSSGERVTAGRFMGECEDNRVVFWT